MRRKVYQIPGTGNGQGQKSASGIPLPAFPKAPEKYLRRCTDFEGVFKFQLRPLECTGGAKKKCCRSATTGIGRKLVGIMTTISMRWPAFPTDWSGAAPAWSHVMSVFSEDTYMNVRSTAAFVLRSSATAPVLARSANDQEHQCARTAARTSSSSAFGRRPTSAGCARCCCSGWICRGRILRLTFAVGRRLQVIGLPVETSTLVAGTDEPAVAVPEAYSASMVSFATDVGTTTALRIGKLAPESRVALNHECIAVDEEILFIVQTERTCCQRNATFVGVGAEFAEGAARHRGVRGRKHHLASDGGKASGKLRDGVPVDLLYPAMASAIWR